MTLTDLKPSVPLTEVLERQCGGGPDEARVEGGESGHAGVDIYIEDIEALGLDTVDRTPGDWASSQCLKNKVVRQDS